MKPTIKQFVITVLPYLILLVAMYSILSYPSSSLPYLVILNKTVVWWALSFFILIVFYLSNNYFLDTENKKNLIVLNIYMFWIIICIIRGAFIAETYWDWKGLVNNMMGLLLPIVAYSATNKVIVQSILSTYIKYGLPLFIILMVFIRADAFGFYLMPVSFLLLFLPALTTKQRVILFSFALVVLISDLGARSNVIKFSMPLMTLSIYYFRKYLSNSILESGRLILIIAPFVFLSLGASGVFNLFNMDDYLGEQRVTKTIVGDNQSDENLAADTRTFIYVEVVQSAIKNNYWLFGRTPARGNDSMSFGVDGFEFTGRYERLSNEVGIANVFTWMGVFGVFLYLLVFIKASYLAVNRSNNIYAKMIGIYVAFRWLYSWIEDVNNFSINYFMLWIMIGLCFSYSFRKMSDYEVSIWIRGVFDKRYLNFEEHLKKEENEK